MLWVPFRVLKLPGFDVLMGLRTMVEWGTDLLFTESKVQFGEFGVVVPFVEPGKTHGLPDGPVASIFGMVDSDSDDEDEFTDFYLEHLRDYG